MIESFISVTANKNKLIEANINEITSRLKDIICIFSCVFLDKKFLNMVFILRIYKSKSLSR